MRRLLLAIVLLLSLAGVAGAQWRPRTGYGSAVLATLTSEISVANSTADTTILTSSVAAYALTPGSVYRFTARGWVDNASLAAGTITFWMKHGTTKVIELPVPTPAYAAQADKPWVIAIEFHVRTTGATGTAVLAGEAYSDIPANESHFTLVQNGTTTIDTTVLGSMTLGMSWGVANAENIAVASQAALERMR